ncbi:hypothetical protein BRC90_10865 [Halobacteriales archaeon QS_4_69_34]|nr:MAG: hypothetical protein BRC90_10865 [Halobacteriales archaeon QS_4_69_34]
MGAAPAPSRPDTLGVVVHAPDTRGLGRSSAGPVAASRPGSGPSLDGRRPVVIPTSQDPGVPVGQTVLAYTFGASPADLVQSFRRLPLLAIADVRARDVFGYAIVMFPSLLPVILVAVVVSYAGVSGRGYCPCSRNTGVADFEVETGRSTPVETPGCTPLSEPISTTGPERERCSTNRCPIRTDDCVGFASIRARNRRGSP